MLERRIVARQQDAGAGDAILTRSINLEIIPPVW
jgi:hypothetical protein